MRRIDVIPSFALAVGLLLVLVGCKGGSPTAPSSPFAPASPIMWSGNGHHYQLSLTLDNEAVHFLTWTQARARAESLSFQGVSGHLVTITSAAENAFLIDRIVPAPRTPAPLIGGFQPPGSREPDGGWRWVTGEPFIYTNWGSQEPNEALPDADFLIFFDQEVVGTWNDVIDLESIYIIEYDTAPVSGGSPMVDISGGQATIPEDDVIVGWVFDLSVPMTVDGLGVWDDAMFPGLTLDHRVGLWTVGGMLIAHAFVSGGNEIVPSSSGLGNWLFSPITPITLQPGTYVIGSDPFGSDETRSGGGLGSREFTITPVAGVTYLFPAFGVVDPNELILSFPENFRPESLGSHHFGPNLRVRPVP